MNLVEVNVSDTSIINIDDDEMWGKMIPSCTCRVAVEFYTTWCRESQMMLTVMNQMRPEFPGILFCRCNMDKMHYQPDRLGVTGVPSIVLLVPIPMLLKPNAGPVHQSLVVELIKGFISADMFREKLKAFMNWSANDQT